MRPDLVFGYCCSSLDLQTIDTSLLVSYKQMLQQKSARTCALLYFFSSKIPFQRSRVGNPALSLQPVATGAAPYWTKTGWIAVGTPLRFVEKIPDIVHH
jgi:hypothetical protein